MSDYNKNEWCSCGEHFARDERYCQNCGKERIELSNQYNNPVIPQEGPQYKCPSCGKEMHHGYIYSPRPMTWKESDSKWFFRAHSINSEASGFHFFTGHQLESYRCEGCQIMLIHY